MGLKRVETGLWLRSMGSARVSLLEASVELSALVMPPEMATVQRLRQDLDLSAQVGVEMVEGKRITQVVLKW